MSTNPYHPKLTFVGEPFDGRTYDLKLETTSVGRSSQNQLCIQDASVSAKHCEILAHGSEIIVRDLKSSNGTFINAVRLDGQAQLKHGQILRIGNVNARLELASVDASETASDNTAVYQHAKAVQAARKEREQPQSPPQPVTLDSGSPDAPPEHTIAMSRADVGSSPSPASAPAPATAGDAGSGSARWIWAVLLAGIAIAVFLIFRK